MPTLSHNGQFFIFKGTFEERHLPKEAKFFWCPTTRKWKTDNLKNAAKLVRFADGQALKILNKKLIRVQSAPSVLNWPTDKTPYPFQIESAQFAASRNRSYIADDPGLGKTASAIMARNTDPGPTLVICPPFLKLNWKAEIERWSSFIEFSVSILTPAMLKAEEDFKRTNWLIVPDSLIARKETYALLRDYPFKWAIIDEAHRFKESQTQRSIALYGATEGLANRPPVFKAERIICLSGTPIPNRPIEIFPNLQAFAPEVIDFQNRFEFGVKYCDAFEDAYGWDFSGSSNEAELNERLKTYMIRHKKVDVLKELPPKLITEIVLPNDDASPTFHKLEAEALTGEGLNTIFSDEDVARLGQIARFQSTLGVTKVDVCLDFILDILKSTTEKIIVGAHHEAVIRRLTEGLKEYGANHITGKTPSDERHRIVESFQNNPTLRVLIGNIQAMGVGLTITKATRVVMVEWAWSPGVNEQFEDRAHRITQEDRVLVHYLLYGSNGFDRYKLDRAGTKAQTIEKILGR